jgi:hypothetical protein
MALNMKSRIAISALYALIAAGACASHANVFQKLKASWSCKTSDARAVQVSKRTGSGSPAPVSDFRDVTKLLGSRARHLQHCVLNLIDSHHQGE